MRCVYVFELPGFGRIDMTGYLASRDLLNVRVNRFNGRCFVQYQDASAHVEVMRSALDGLEQRGFWRRFYGGTGLYEGCDADTLRLASRMRLV